MLSRYWLNALEWMNWKQSRTTAAGIMRCWYAEVRILIGFWYTTPLLPLLPPLIIVGFLYLQAMIRWKQLVVFWWCKTRAYSELGPGKKKARRVRKAREGEQNRNRVLGKSGTHILSCAGIVSQRTWWDGFPSFQRLCVWAACYSRPL